MSIALHPPRLLPKDQSDAIIGEVEKVLRSSGFRPESPLIEIMNPMEEGLFAWFTVNFLLEQFSKPVEDRYDMIQLGRFLVERVIMLP